MLNNDFRHPAFVAREAAMLDLLTDGRFELGLGAGHAKPEYDEIGLGFDRPSVRIARLSEAVPIVKSLLAGVEVTHVGEHYRLSGHQLFPPGPLNVPLFLGGNGRRLLELAAREADTVGFTGFSARRGGAEIDLSGFGEAGAAERVAIVRDAAGERFDELELNVLLQRVVVTDDPDAAAGEIAEDFGLGAEQALGSPFLLLGSHESMAEQLVERRERFGFTYVTVFEDALEAFAPVVARLA